MNYGCYNRKPFVKEYQGIPFRMSPDCEYQKTDKYADPGCVGCIHKTILRPDRSISQLSANHLAQAYPLGQATSQSSLRVPG